MTLSLSRRGFLRTAAAALAAPYIVPASVLGKAADKPAPSNVITLGCIGVGRMGRDDMKTFLGLACRVVAVCDVDSKRLVNAKEIVDKFYAAKDGATAAGGCAALKDFRDLLARPDVDAVSIVTPDHWHCLNAIAAAQAGKDIFLQKPVSYSVAEGRAMADAVARYGRVFQTGSQLRSDSRFRLASELVRNGRIGKLHTATVFLEVDPACKVQPPMPVPENLDYDFWLGPAPWAPYTEERVHPQNGYGRPGWLRMDDYCGGMLTGWGTHDIDQAQWGMDTEATGPVTLEGRGEFPADGLWDVHGKFRVDCTYSNGLKLAVRHGSSDVLFEGTDGWVRVNRSRIDAGPKSLLRETIGPTEMHLYVSNNHKANFLECIRTRQPCVAPAETGHRSATICHLCNIALKTQRPLRWDPAAERFVGDDEANRYLARPMRGPWAI